MSGLIGFTIKMELLGVYLVDGLLFGKFAIAKSVGLNSYVEQRGEK